MLREIKCFMETHSRSMDILKDEGAKQQTACTSLASLHTVDNGRPHTWTLVALKHDGICRVKSHSSTKAHEWLRMASLDCADWAVDQFSTL